MKVKINELRQLDVSEMRDRIDAREKELYDLRYKAYTSQVEKPHRIKEARKEIAVYKTLIKEKERRDAIR